MKISNLNFSELCQVSTVNYMDNSRLSVKNNVSSGLNKISYANMPSFAARKPLTEDEKCKKLLLDAKNPNGSMRFPTKNEINSMYKALKNFKTDLNKAEVIKSLLTYSMAGCAGNSDLSANDIITYLKELSGAPSDMQRYMALELGESTSENVTGILNLVKSSKLNKNALEYINKNLTGDDYCKQTKFSYLCNWIYKCPDLANYKKIIIDKLNLNDTSGDIIPNIDKIVGSCIPKERNAKSIATVVSFMNEDNISDMRYFSERLFSASSRFTPKLLNNINKNNFDYVLEALQYEDIGNIALTLASIKEKKLILPPKAHGVADYYALVNNLIYPGDELELRYQN